MTYYAKRKQPQKPQPKRSKWGSTVVGIALAAAVFFGSVGVCLNTDKPKVAEDFKPAATEVAKHKHGPKMALTIARHFEPAPEARSLKKPQHYTFANGALSGKSEDGQVRVSLSEVDLHRATFANLSANSSKFGKTFLYVENDSFLETYAYDLFEISITESRTETYDGYQLTTEISCIDGEHGPRLNKCEAHKSLIDEGKEYSGGDYVNYAFDTGKEFDQRNTRNPLYFDKTLSAVGGLSKDMIADVNKLLAPIAKRMWPFGLNISQVFEYSVDPSIVGLNYFWPLSLNRTVSKDPGFSSKYKTVVRRAAHAITQEEYINGVKTGTIQIDNTGSVKIVRETNYGGVHYSAITLWDGKKGEPVTDFSAVEVQTGQSLTIKDHREELTSSDVLRRMALTVQTNGSRLKVGEYAKK